MAGGDSHLAALSLKDGGHPGSAALSFGGDERLVSEYIQFGVPVA